MPNSVYIEFVRKLCMAPLYGASWDKRQIVNMPVEINENKQADIFLEISLTTIFI